MTIRRMDHVGVVVEDLPAAIAIFVELGLELEGEAPVEGRWVDRVVGLDGVRVDIAIKRTPDVVDACGESEQRAGFYTMIEEHLDVPFEVEILGVAATVDQIDMTDDEHIVAISRWGRSRQALPILRLPLPKGVVPSAVEFRG